MRRIIETAHHQGESIIQHARKHHKKYLWGAAGFFGLFKLFSFLIVSILSYNTIIAANIPSTTSIVIPATTIDIQEGKSIIQFDLSDVDIGNYTSIQNIDLRMDIETQEKTVDIETLWNSITTSIGQPSSTNMLAIQLWAADKDTRTINPENISGIIQQLQSGNTIAYFLPQENVNIQSGTIVMEIEVATQQEMQQENEGTGIVLFEGLGKDTIVQQSKSLEKEIKQYEKIKKNIITKKDTTLIKDAKTLENIQLESDDQKIQVKIPKDTKLMTKKEMDFEGSINQPQEIALDALSSKPQSKGIYAFEVGDPDQSIHFKKEDNSSQNIDITIYIDSGTVSSGEYVRVYYSEDQIIWNTLGNSIIHQDEEGKFYLNIQVDHMTTFYIGADEFSFFLSDNSCNNNLEIITRDGKSEWPVYACMQGANSSAIKSFRLSDKDTADVETKSRDAFSSPYNKFSTFGIDTSNFWGPITLYAQYAYDEKDYKTRGTTSDQIIVARQGDFSFYISDDGCDTQTTSAIDQSILYLCTNGTYSDSATDLRISTVSEKDLSNQDWQGGYATNYEFLLSGEGKTTVYVEYKYTADQEYRSEIVSQPITISKTSQSTATLKGTIASGASLDVSNKYRIVSSPDGISALTLNSAEKSSTITVSQATWDGTLSAPSLITAGTKKANKGETGLAKGFIPTDTYEVGDDTARLSLSGTNFSVSLLVTDTKSIGKSLKIYSSQDGTTWTDENKTCIVGSDRSCTFSTSHLTLFTVGSITRDNLQFVNQDFRTAGPTTIQVFDAFFGTGGNPSAYTTHWTGSCYPTSIVNRNPGTRGATNLAANTIYILSSGNYIQNGTLTMNGNCIALIGKGNVTIDTSGNIGQTIYATTKTGIIIDNIQINNSGTTNYGIYLNNQTTNVTLNDIQANKYNQYGIILVSTTNSLISNCQGFNNAEGFYIQNSAYCTINNCQSYNNSSYGIYGNNNSGLFINNTQLYNNGICGIYAYVTTGLIINNSQIYNNSMYGIQTLNSPSILINNTKIFKNSTNGQISLSSSNGIYYGNNTAYPNPNTAGLAAGGNNPGGLGWTAGTMSTTDPGFSCNFVTRPINGFGTGLFSASDCSNIGRVATRTGKEIVTYNYGNNMLSGQYVLRQIRPVAYSAGSLILSSIPYHGHRFIGEYDDPSGKDKNTPVILFTGETPINGFNLINTGFYTLRSYIYEPNLSSLHLSDRSGADFTSYYPYDSSLIFMVNFDKVEEIGETNTLVKDLSLNKNSGTVSGATWTENGKWNGAYIFNGTNNFIGAENSLPSNSITIQLWFKTNASVRGILFGQSNAIPPTAAGAFVPTIVMQANGKIRTEFWVGAITSGVTPAAYNDNQWHQITVVGSGTTQTTYIDGTIVESHTTATSINNSRRTKSTIGVGYDSVNRGGSATMWKYFSGYIDEPRVRNRALNASEIYTMYNSNLSAKADHREYVKNYTGIYSRPYGDFNYTFEYTDSDNNGGETTRNLNKYQTCTRTNWRNNDNFITGGFWTHNPAPTDCDIIAALYGTGTDGSDLTAYTSNWTGRNGSCNYTSLNVVHITGGTDKIPSTLAENTIYVLANGTYIQTSSPAITYSTCSAIIGQTGDIKIYSTNSIGYVLYNDVINTITDNIQVDGYNNGGGGTHTRDTVGFMNYAGAKNASINNISVQYTNHGIYFKGSTYNQVTNSKIYNNQKDGIYVVGNYNLLSGIQAFGNNTGILIGGSSYNTLNNIQIYSNTGAGIGFESTINHLTLNNIQTFNNAYGIQTNDSSNKDYISVNNSQIYNNANDGMLLYRTNYFTINNSHIYNNGNNGVYFASTNNNSGILNNVWSYNNNNRPLMSDGGTHKYYGLLNYFDNGINLTLGTFNAGTYNTYSTLGRTGGNTNTNGCINCSWISNGFDNLGGGSLLIDTTSYPKCNLRGNNASRAATGDLSYKYGISLTGQKQPVFRSDTTLMTSSLPYSGARYVAEINRIGTYTNTQCTCAGHTYRRNNDNFITSSFWNHNPAPDYCDIIDALYGQGPEEGDFTAYTKYRNAQRNGQCNADNVEVVYKTGGTNTLETTPSDYKIYVLNSGTYTNAYTIAEASLCNFILGSGTVTLRSTATLTSLVSKYGNYGGIDNIMADGGSGNIDYGIRLDTTLNNTIHNVSSLRNLNYGFYLNDTLRTLLQDVFAYNNLGDGIYIKEGSHYNEYTTINNGMTYNNSGYGINIYQAPRKLAINNFQIFNNNSGGILIASSQKTILNNINIYNNKGYGIEGNAPSLSTIDVAIYNNSGSINLSGLHYYNTLSIFGNKVNTVSGSIYQGVSTDFTNIYVNNGQLINTNTMSRDYITNPQTNNYLLSFSGGSFTGLIGNKSFSTSQRVNYSYGSGIYTQKTPIQYSGINPTTGGGLLFSGIQFIGSNLVKITGDLSGVPSTTTTPSLSVVGISNSSLVSKYSVFGDILGFKIGQAKNTSTGIDLITGLSINRIITQLFDPSGYFAMHFQKQTEIVSLCLSGWDNDNFIDDTFRAQNPTDNNIICAIYGSGASDQTAYTKTWPSYQGDCSVSNGETVKYAFAPETEPLAGMGAYTVYIFPSGTYNLYHDIELKNCVAFISTGTTTINGSTYSTIVNAAYNVIDNLNIDGGGTSNNGVVKFLNNNKGSTIHGMNIYNGNYGVYAYNSQHNLIDSNNMFGNTEGIYIDSSDSNIISNTITYNNTALGINIISSKFTTINNNQSYNNDGIGIHMDNSSNTSINNTLVYNNNEDGIYGENGSEYTTINNAEIFNNNYNGIYGADAKGIISNVRVYNNGACGYNRNNTVYYYNENHFISNQNGNICSSSLNQGGSADYPSLGWNDGDVYDEGENYHVSPMILSWDYFMNPKNSSDEYLLPWRNSDYTSILGMQTFNNNLPITYSYGKDILLQSQPVMWDAAPTFTTGLTFDTNRYIGGNTIKYDGDLEVDPITRTTPMTVTGTANTSEISGYNIYGSDLDSSYTTMPINTNTQIEFTVGDGIKKIITQIYSPIYFATHFEKSTILDTTPPTGTILINTGARYTYNANTTLALSANDANGVTQMQFSCNASSWTTPEAYSTSKSFNITNQTAAGCSAGDGTKRVYVRYKDTIGNRSTAIAGDIILNTILDCAAGRDNNNFITSSFRAGSPTNDNIICALYGSGVGDTTAYTQFWTGWDTTQCSGIQMNVIYTGNLSLTTLASNTIYVLTDNTSIGNGTTSLSNCTAVISNQTTGTTFYSTTWLGNNNSIFYGANNNNVIFDNIIIDGTSDGNGGTHTGNGNGIHINNNSKNISMNNIISYNNQSAGIYFLFGPTSNHISNSKFFNNTLGMHLWQTQNNTIENSQIYNNSYGFLIRNTTNTTINNSQIYNNNNGIIMQEVSGIGMVNSTISNSQIYNNTNSAIRFGGASTGNNLYNTRIYNNNISGIVLDASATNNKYYGTNILFNNGQNIGGTITNLTTGSSSDYPGIFSNGTLSTVGTMSRDYITNPINANSTYLLPWTGTWAGIRGKKTFTGVLPIRYSYGSGILTQIQPIYYSGASLKTGGIFDATKYIGSDTIKVTGDLLGLDTITSSSLSITGISSNGLINRYSIFGDINNMIGQTINTSTGITINTGLSINRIVAQLYYSPAGYFATHFEKDIEISSPIIYFTGSTPTSGTTITGNNFKPQIEMITTGGLATFNYIFSGITYPYYDSGLVLMMNFDNVTALGETAGGIIKDFSQYGNNGSVIGQTIWTGNGRRNGAYIFNGTGTNTFNGEIAIYGITTPQYLSSRGTIAYWINITKKDIGQGIFHLFEDSNPTTKYIRNYISGNNFIDLVIENEDTTELNVTYDLDNLGIIENQWIYIAWTQDGNGVKLYINGQEKTLGGTNTGIRWTDHLTGTKTITIGSARGTFSGAIDELRIYNRALTSGQILQMRRSNFQKYDTDKWRFTDDRQCMGSGSYTYSGYVMNTLGLSATTGRFNLISLINPFVTAADYFIGTTGVSTTQRTLSGQFTGYFTVDDWKGATGWHSTIQLPLTMTGVNYSTNKIINDGTNIKFMAAGLAVTGSNTGNLVYINPDLNSYTGFTAPKQYIQRDYSQGYSCPSGIYGNKPHISIDIPGYQNPDTYNGMITIDMDQ